ncbi:gamma-glutamyltransferase [Bacillus sp. CGMCC 1.16541]|uniref:gamma-glutamyltransferase n=1 Tax=Bacillus sp. CGMCC 1.16541 TaxID=2185143 RepID=UPI000D72DDE2|nr:gamma-glutamyltransferase [Bacillus sp. CGMCC 1.16541]
MQKKVVPFFILLHICLLFGIAPLQIATAEGDHTDELIDFSDNYGVSASHPLAVEVGMDVLKNGGNAVDAAIAVSYTLSVVEPFGSGIGGGGQTLLLPPKESEPIVYDYWVTAPSNPKAASEQTGVPGFVKGMDKLHKDYGSKPFSELISPAIDLANEGFEIDYLLSQRLGGGSKRLPVDDLPRFYPNGKHLQPGDTLKQPELAETLMKIKEDGADAFYRGEVGESFLKVAPHITKKDLENYKVKETKPTKVELEKGTVYSASAPLAGITLAQSLKLAEKVDIESTKDSQDEFVHLMAEIARVTNNDRVKEVGDPNFEELDVNDLVSDAHITKLADEMSSKPSTEMENDGEKIDDKHTDTTHFVIIDKNGMTISTTNTLSNFFGSGQYTDGFFVNNALDNFSSYSTSLNNYEPNKRSRSFSAPTIVVTDEKVLGIGSPGGRRIPTVMAQVLSRHLYMEKSLEDAVDAPRFYGENGYLYIEEEFPEELTADMIARGYNLEPKLLPIYFGGIQALELDKSSHDITGIADIRRSGTWDAKDKGNALLEGLVLFFFIIGISFPLLHLFHCLPWFRDKQEEMKYEPDEEDSMSILVPCYNEQGIIETSIESMKKLAYSNFEVLYINDGSKDHTMSLLDQFLQLKLCTKSPLKQLSNARVKAVYQSELYPHMYVIDKVNGGKADALNAGIEYASNNLVITLDADTVLTEEALTVVNEKFADCDVVAAGGMVHILQTKTTKPLSHLSLLKANLLLRLQTLDFLKAFYITKVSLARFDALAVISGAFGIFRKQVLLDVGGYRSSIGEDIDITLRIHQYIHKFKNKKILLIPDAVSYTELPETWEDFFKQRVRWQKAFIDCVIHFRSFFTKTLFKKGVSFFYIFESFFAGTLSAYVMAILFIVRAIYYPPDSYTHYMMMYLIYMFIFGFLYSLMALLMNKHYGFSFENRDFGRLLTTLLIDVFLYRFVIIYIVMYGSIAYFFNHNWNKVERTGRKYQTDSQSAA